MLRKIVFITGLVALLTFSATFSWADGTWDRNLMVREAFWALDHPSHPNEQWGGWAIGDWNYLESYEPAYRVVHDHYYGCYWSGLPYYESIRGSGYEGVGGECKFFVNLLRYRGTYNRERLLTNYEVGNRWWALEGARYSQPGDIIVRNGIDHWAVVVINFGNGQLDVIDSNYVLHHVTGRHVVWADEYRIYNPVNYCW